MTLLVIKPDDRHKYNVTDIVNRKNTMIKTLIDKDPKHMRPKIIEISYRSVFSFGDTPNEIARSISRGLPAPYDTAILFLISPDWDAADEIIDAFSPYASYVQIDTLGWFNGH